MDFDSPDVMKDFPGLYASELNKQCNIDSDYSDDNEKVNKKDILIGKRKEKKDKDKGYAALEGESSADENVKSRSPSKAKKAKSFKFTTKTKEKRDKSREKEKEMERKKDKDKKSEAKVERSKGEKSKKIKQSADESVDIAEVSPIFGVSLELAVNRSKCHDSVNIPLPVRECIDFIEAVGMSFEGVYKVSGTKSKVLYIRKIYNQRGTINLIDYDVPTVTSLLKNFLRDLPEPVFTNDLLIRFEEAGAILNFNTREKHLKILLDHLPPLNKLFLCWLITHLYNVSLNEKFNKMNKQGLAVALNHTFHCSSRLLGALIHHSPALFPNFKIEKYIPPLESGAKLPEERDEIEVELEKQESLLSQIHNEMIFGSISKEREELLWEVQRIITQLKRKLKTFNKDKESLVVEKIPEEIAPPTTEEIKSIEIVNKEPEMVPDVPLEEEQLSENHCDDVNELQEVLEEEKENFQGEPASDLTITLLELKNEGLHQLRDYLLMNLEKERNDIIYLKKQLIYPLPTAELATSENLDEVMDLFVKENQILQIKKINLVRQIIEEQEMCIELKAQLMALKS